MIQIWTDFIVPVVKLFALAVVTGGLLGLTMGVIVKIIEEAQ